MTITLNGQCVVLAPGSTVADLLTDWRGIAVAVNGEVVTREQRATTALHEGDVVEVVTAVQGG